MLQVGKFSEMGEETHTELIVSAASVEVFPQRFFMLCRVALLGKRRGRKESRTHKAQVMS